MQLAQVNNDLFNLLTNVSIPIVMLGNDLRIRRFTPISEKLLNLNPTDVGRPISDMKFNIDIPHLKESLLEVIEHLTPKVMQVKHGSGRSYSLRIRPYRTEDNKIDGVVMVLVDIESGRSLEGDLLATDPKTWGLGEPSSADQMTLLTQRLVGAQEEERRRVARELHDDLSQKVALLEFNVEWLRQSAAGEGSSIAGKFSALQEQVSQLSYDIRRVAYSLHPSVLDDLGLIAALQSHIDDVRRTSGVDVTFSHDDVPEVRPEIGLTIYRVVQEALRNVVKHASVQSASVSLEQVEEDRLRVIIKDGGVGFNPAKSRGDGLGILAMQERAKLAGGSLAVVPEPRKGTEIHLDVPLEGFERN